MGGPKSGVAVVVLVQLQFPFLMRRIILTKFLHCRESGDLIPWIYFKEGNTFNFEYEMYTHFPYLRGFTLTWSSRMFFYLTGVF